MNLVGATTILKTPEVSPAARRSVSMVSLIPNFLPYVPRHSSLASSGPICNCSLLRARDDRTPSPRHCPLSQG